MVGDAHAAIESSRADAGERDPVAVRWIHVGLDLEHECRERALERSWLAGAVDPRRWRRRQFDDGVEQHPHAEVGQRRSDEHRRRLAGEERGQVDVGTDRVEQRALVERCLPRGAVLAAARCARDVEVGGLLGSGGCATRGSRELGVATGSAIDQALEFIAIADGPGGGRRSQFDLLLDLVEQLEWVRGPGGRTC